jgi:hypothetical protein
LIGCLDEADTFAVVTAHRKFGDAGEPANVGKRVVDSGSGGNRPPRLWEASIRERLSHDRLVVGEGQGLRRREYGCARLAQVAQVIQWHVFVVEGDDVNAFGKSDEVLEVSEITNMAGSELRGRALSFGKDSELKPQVNCCRNHHPR